MRCHASIHQTTASAGEHRVWRVGRKFFMRSSSDERELLQEAVQCQHSCEVVSSKTYVKRNTTRSTASFIRNYTRHAGQCSLFLAGSARAGPGHGSDRTLLQCSSAPSMPLPFRVGSERPQLACQGLVCAVQCMRRNAAHFVQAFGRCALSISSGHAADGGCKAMHPNAS